MEEKINIFESFNSKNYANNKLQFTKKTKLNLGLKAFLITLFTVFFAMNVVIYSNLESIELKLYRNDNYYFFPSLNLSLNYKKTIDILMKIIAGLDSLTVYISIIYLHFHPFAGLKLVFVMNLSHYFLLLIKIIMKGHRPIWGLADDELIKNSYVKTIMLLRRFIFLFFLFFLYIVFLV